MAVSSFAGGSQRRRSRTNTNPYAQAAAQQNRQRFTRSNARKTYSNPYAQAAAQQQPAVDPLTNMLSQQQQMMMAQSGGSMGAQPSMADAQGGGGVSAPVNQQPSMADAQGTGASQPANMPPPPPPPPPAPPAPQPTMAQMQGTGNVAPVQPAPQPSMADAQGTGQASALSPQEQMAMAQQGIIDPITQALSGATSNQQAMFDAQNQQLGNISNTLSGVTDAQQAMFDAQNQRFADAISGSTASQQAMFDAQNRGFTDAISGATDAQRQMFDQQNQQLSGISEILNQQIAMQQAQQSQADQRRQAQLDMQEAQRANRQQQAQLAMQEAQQFNSRLGDALRGGTGAQNEMALRQGGGAPPPTYTNPYEQAALLQRGTPTMSPSEEMAARQGGGMSPQEEMAARQGAGLPDLSGYRSPYEEAALAQGGDVTATPTPTGATDAQAEMFAQQGGGLQTFASTGGTEEQLAMQEMQQLSKDPALESQLRAQLEMAARQGDGGLRTFAARGSRFNRGAEQLRRQAGRRPSGTLQDRLEQAYMGRIDAANDPILASQIADQQLRQQEAQQGLVEQLSRYGVLRGGGDTAAALTRMAEGNERNRLALEAAAAQRRQGDLRDASAFDQARSAMNIAQRGQSLEERIGADRLLDTALARDVTRAGQTGRFQGMDTLAAQEQDQRMRLAMADATGLLDTGAANQAPIETLAGARQRRELDLAESAQETRDRLAEQDVASSALARDVTRAGLTGQFERQDTLAAQLQRQQMDLAEDANRRADAADRRAGIAQRAGLLGEIDGEGSAPARTTLAGRELALREDIARAEDLRAQQAAESALFGQVVTGAANQAPIATLEGQRAQSDLDTAALAREATEAGLTGRFDGALTTAERDADLARRISEAGVTGAFDTGSATQGPIDTIQSQVIESSLQNEALNRGLARAGATGLFREEGDTGPGTETLESRLRTAGLTGELDNQLTLGGRQAEQDLIGSILAASDPELKGRTDALATALTGRLGAEEQQRMQASFLDEFEALGDDADFDDFFQLAERYGNVPVVAEALEEILSQGDPEVIRQNLEGMSTSEKFEYLKRLKEQGYAETVRGSRTGVS